MLKMQSIINSLNTIIMPQNLEKLDIKKYEEFSFLFLELVSVLKCVLGFKIVLPVYSHDIFKVIKSWYRAVKEEKYDYSDEIRSYLRNKNIIVNFSLVNSLDHYLF